eukprot:11413845-Prorocentrum_lima.AAC.1
MTSSLVGSEMCIRDRPTGRHSQRCQQTHPPWIKSDQDQKSSRPKATKRVCLLYTSDAADDM